MSFVTFANGMLEFTVPPATQCHIQVEWSGPGAKKLKIDGDSNYPVIYVSCPPLTPPPPNAKFIMLLAGQFPVHDVMVDPTYSRSMKITPLHENGTPCPAGGIDPNDKFTGALETWTYQDPREPRRQGSAWQLITSVGDCITIIIIVEPDSGGGASTSLMNKKPFKRVSAYLSMVHTTLQALLAAWSHDLKKIK